MRPTTVSNIGTTQIIKNKSTGTATTIKPILHASQLQNPELKFIATQLAALRLDIFQNNTLIKNVLLDASKFNIKLPLQDNKDVIALSSKIDEDKDEIFINNLIKYFRKFEPKEKCYASSGLASIMTDEVILEYNWEGQKEKLPLKNLTLFNKVIYGSNCDIVLHSSKSKNGTFMTPLFPAAYPARSFCRIEFQGEGKERVQIIFFEFSLPSDGDNYNCLDSDNLQVLIPIRRRYEPVETLCGDQTLPKPILSDGPKMLLEFRGRRSGKGNRGFKAEYKFVENFGIISGRQLPGGECSFSFNASSERNGWFHSPNFPGSYPRNLICNYYFYGQPNDKVLIRFTYFDVEGIYPCGDNSASDYVEFSNFMSVDRKYRKYCGKQNGFPLESDGRFFRITFHTNDRFDKTGFRASYQFVAAATTTEGTTATRSIQKNNKSTKNISENLWITMTAVCIIYKQFLINL